MIKEPYRELWKLITRPVFLITDLIGVALLFTSQLFGSSDQLAAIPWKAVLATIGSAVLTIGLSLPIALFYQLRANAEALNIIDACNRSGIRAIFESRQKDSLNLRTAIDIAASSSTEILLLGVAFRSLFNPSGEYTPQMRERLDDPRIGIRVLLLDPNCKAAQLRANIEKGNTTIEDIRFTLENGIPLTCRERLGNLESFTMPQSQAEFSASDIATARKLSNCEVHIYENDPMLFLMAFQHSVFCEPYHIGRPKNHRSGSCIGKNVPLIEYSDRAPAVKFLREHFESVWEISKDVTNEVIVKAVLPED